MKDPFVMQTVVDVVDSPTKAKLTNMDSSHRKKVFHNTSFAKSRRALRSGAEKISRTIRIVRNSFGNISQHFGLNTRHRHRLSENLTPCRTPTPTKKKKQLLGRSPTKLYSPFGIETPNCRDHRMSPYMPDTPDHGFSPKHRKSVTRSWHLLTKKHPRALFH